MIARKWNGVSDYDVLLALSEEEMRMLTEHYQVDWSFFWRNGNVVFKGRYYCFVNYSRKAIALPPTRNLSNMDKLFDGEYCAGELFPAEAIDYREYYLEQYSHHPLEDGQNMKNLVVLFVYRKLFPFTIGGADNYLTVALDCIDGRAYILWFYDDENLDSCLSVEEELTYDEVRKQARRAAGEGLLDNPGKYDMLSESTWKEFAAHSHPHEHFIVYDNGEWYEDTVPRLIYN